MNFPNTSMINNSNHFMDFTTQFTIPAKADELPTFNGFFEAVTDNPDTMNSNSNTSDLLTAPQTTGTFHLLLKKRDPKNKIVKSTDPEATISDIIADKTLTTHPRNKNKIQKTDNDTTTFIPVTTTSTTVATEFIFQDGKLVPVTTTTTVPVVNKVIQNTRVTSSSFKTLIHTDKWTDNDNKKFLDALEMFGADFSMIALMFPKRTIKQMKAKFLKEEKVNPDSIKKALYNNVHKNIKNKFDLELLIKIQSGTADFAMLMSAIQN